MGTIRIVYKILVGKSEGKKPLGRPECIWEDNIRMDFWVTGWRGVDWMHIGQDKNQWQALVNMIMNL
jgi:hypothetical protein